MRIDRLDLTDTDTLRACYEVNTDSALDRLRHAAEQAAAGYDLVTWTGPGAG